MSAGRLLCDLLRIERDDLERALAAQARDDGAVALVQRQLDGLATRAGVERLNDALAIDAFELLAPGWPQVPAVRDALARGRQSPDRTSIVTLGKHEIASTVHPVLSLTMAQAALPELRLTLSLRAHFGSVTLALRDGRIDTVAPRDAAADLRLTYGELLLKQRSHAVWQLPDEIRISEMTGAQSAEQSPERSAEQSAEHLGRKGAERSDAGAIERAAVGSGSQITLHVDADAAGVDRHR